MRGIVLISLCAGGMALAGCNSDRRDEPAAHRAGREAYKLNQEGKKAAKELGRDLKNAGREARQGWNEAQRQDQERKKK